jgi:hypothetical protein
MADSGSANDRGICQHDVVTYDKIVYKPDLPPIRRRTKLIGAMIVVVLIALCFWPWGHDDASDGRDAQTACENLVKDRLRSTSSIRFSDLARSGASDTWTITGDVDAGNNVGASIRSHFTCTVQLRDGHWQLQSLTGLQ